MHTVDEQSTGMDIPDQAERVAAECADFLCQEPSIGILKALERAGVTEDDLEKAVAVVTEATPTHGDVIRLRERCQEALNGDIPYSVERVLLARYASRNIRRVAGLPISDAAKQATLRFVSAVVHGPVKENDTRLRAGHPHFGATSRSFQCTRFLGGEFDWDVSGIPLSWIARLEVTALPGFISCLATKLGGRAPMFYFHLGIDRSGRSLDPVATKCAFMSMAESMASQPDIRGCLAAPWWCSKDTVRVSPHLAWFREFLLDNGAYIADMRPVDPHCGALARSGTRERLYKEGRYRPRRALTVWPRASMLRWASRVSEIRL